jgi:hypothetical protein
MPNCGARRRTEDLLRARGLAARFLELPQRVAAAQLVQKQAIDLQQTGVVAEILDQMIRPDLVKKCAGHEILLLARS